MNYIYLLFLDVASAEKLSVGANLNAWDAILSASWVVQLTLLSLIAMSIISWAIIFRKKKQYQLQAATNEEFLKVFWAAQSFDEIYDRIEEFEESSMARIFRSGYSELRKLADSNLAQAAQEEDGAPILTGIDNLERALRKSIDSEVSELESQLSFLATTGSTGPFIGLFGTVWGIMGSFQQIGATKSASLAIVAPGISEALIATAIGLATAIPATVGFNHFINKLKRSELDFNTFASDFLNLAKRNFFKAQ